MTILDTRLDLINSLFDSSSLSRSEKIILHNFIEYAMISGALSLRGSSIRLSRYHLYVISKQLFDYRDILSRPFTRVLPKRLSSMFIGFILYSLRRTRLLSRVAIRLVTLFFSNRKHLSFVVESCVSAEYWNVYPGIVHIPMELFVPYRFPFSHHASVFNTYPCNECEEVPLDHFFSDGFASTIDRLVGVVGFPRNSLQSPFSFLFFCIDTLFEKPRFFIVDNSQGLLSKSPALLNLIDHRSVPVINMQHGGGFYELNRLDVVFAQSSPAYSYPLVGFFQGPIVRWPHPVNGIVSSLALLPRNSVLIIEVFDPFVRGIIKKNVQRPEFEVDFYTSLFSSLLQDQSSPFLRPHPRSTADWLASPYRKFVLDERFIVPQKYKPSPGDFSFVVILGLGHSLIYHLMQYRIPFVVLARCDIYDLSFYGLEFVSALRECGLLRSPSFSHEITTSYFVDFPERLSLFMSLLRKPTQLSLLDLVHQSSQ